MEIRMTIDQTIALAASVGAFLSAIATFMTVRQMIKQREASYLPELVFTRTYFEASPEPLRASELPEKWVPKSTADMERGLFAELPVPLVNVGLGAAKAVSISWSFPIESTIERINQLAQRALVPAYFSQEGLGISVKSDNLGNGTSMWKNQQNVSIDFVLPISVQKEPAEVKLPHAYILLSSALLFFLAKDVDKNMALDVPSLTADIKYTDIGNNTHSATFIFDLNVIAIAGGGKAFHGFMDCKKLA